MGSVEGRGGDVLLLVVVHQIMRCTGIHVLVCVSRFNCPLDFAAGCHVFTVVFPTHVFAVPLELPPRPAPRVQMHGAIYSNYRGIRCL